MFQLVTVAVMAALVAIDQLIKAAIVATVKVNGSQDLLFGLLRFRYVENTGAAFSLFEHRPEILTVVISVIVICCTALILSHRIKPLIPNICLISVASGGLSNVIDRFTRGYVVDFIEFTFVNFAVFNFADCCITVGAFALLIYEISEIAKEHKSKKVKKDE